MTFFSISFQYLRLSQTKHPSFCLTSVPQGVLINLQDIHYPHEPNSQLWTLPCSIPGVEAKGALGCKADLGKIRCDSSDREQLKWVDLTDMSQGSTYTNRGLICSLLLHKAMAKEGKQRMHLLSSTCSALLASGVGNSRAEPFLAWSKSTRNSCAKPFLAPSSNPSEQLPNAGTG